MASKNKKTVADVIGPLKEKAEILDRVAGILGWQPDDDMVEAARRTIGALDAAVLDLRGEKAAHKETMETLGTLDMELDKARARIAELEAELATCRAEAPAADRGVECLDVGAAVYRDALADFGASVLAGRVLVTFRDAP